MNGQRGEMTDNYAAPRTAADKAERLQRRTCWLSAGTGTRPSGSRHRAQHSRPPMNARLGPHGPMSDRAEPWVHKRPRHVTGTTPRASRAFPRAGTRRVSARVGETCPRKPLRLSDAGADMSMTISCAQLAAIAGCRRRICGVAARRAWCYSATKRRPSISMQRRCRVDSRAVSDRNRQR